MYNNLCNNINDDNDICLICLLPINETLTSKLIINKNKLLNCKCKPKIHYICMNEWINKTNTCPICRKQIILINNNYLFFVYFHKCGIQFAILFFRLFFIISFMKTIYICLTIYDYINLESRP